MRLCTLDLLILSRGDQLEEGWGTGRFTLIIPETTKPFLKQ